MRSRGLRIGLVLTTFGALVTLCRPAGAEERMAGKTLLRTGDHAPVAAASKATTRGADLERATRALPERASEPEPTGRTKVELRPTVRPTRSAHAPLRLERARTATAPWADAAETAPIVALPPAAGDAPARGRSPIDTAFHSLIGLMTPAPVAAEGVRFTPMFLGWSGLGLNVSAKL